MLYGGFGLGLSIVKSIVDEMNGSIDVQSKVGEGTLFELKLSFLTSSSGITSDNPKAKIEIMHLDTSIYRSPYKILLADDSIDNQFLIKAFVKDTPLRFDFADNGKIAYEMSQINNYDLIILDCQMPILNGYDCIKMIREVELEKGRAHVPAIAFTANGYESDINECYKLGFDSYIIKPTSKDAFLRSVYKTILHRKNKAKY